MIKYSLIAILSIVTGWGLKAQSDEDFENLAKDLLILVSDTAKLPRLEYTRIKTYREAVEKQDWSFKEKEEYKYSIEAKYDLEYELFHKNLALLVDRYYQEADDGATAEYFASSYKAKKDFKNRYEAELLFIYRYQGMESIVSFQYEVLYNGKGLLFIGPPIKETF